MLGREDLIPLDMTELRLRMKGSEYMRARIGLGLFKNSECEYKPGLFIYNPDEPKIWNWLVPEYVNEKTVENLIRAMYLADAIGAVDSYLLSHCYEVIENKKPENTWACLHRLRLLNQNIFQIWKETKAENISEKLDKIIEEIQKTMPVAA